METNKRRQNRTKAVLPVRVRGKDKSGKVFEDLAHTLDVNATGVRLGAIRHELVAAEMVTVLYRQRKTEFRVVWTKKLQGSGEYQVGLEAQATDREGWGLIFSDFKATQPCTPPAAAPSQAPVTV
jgi:hypothetical protein